MHFRGSPGELPACDWMIDHGTAEDADRTRDSGTAGEPVSEGTLVDKQPRPGKLAIGEPGEVDRFTKQLASITILRHPPL